MSGINFMQKRFMSNLPSKKKSWLIPVIIISLGTIFYVSTVSEILYQIEQRQLDKEFDKKILSYKKN